ncbi:hypothetical protein AVEN_145748-1, partial [Araneus ventricosus]
HVIAEMGTVGPCNIVHDKKFAAICFGIGYHYMVPELISTLDSSSWSISDDLRVPVVLCWIATPVRSHPEGQVAVITCYC